MDKVTIKQNKPGKETPDFTVVYNKIKEKDRGKASYEIIAALKGTCHLIVEVHTELMSIDYDDRPKAFSDFFEVVKKKGVAFKYKKLPSAQYNLNNFFRMFMQKKLENHQLFISIDENSWTDFFNMIPSFGVKYYLFENNLDPVRMLDDLNSGAIQEDGDENPFYAVIFDCAFIGQMGLFTKKIKYDGLKSVIESKSL
jgi:hypothetical protein